MGNDISAVFVGSLIVESKFQQEASTGVQAVKEKSLAEKLFYILPRKKKAD